jgi:hypothetical protein
MADENAKILIGKAEEACFRLGAAREDGRYAISHLFIDREGEAVATDGRLLLIGPRRRNAPPGPTTFINRETMRGLAEELKQSETWPPHRLGIEGELAESKQIFRLSPDSVLTVQAPDPGKFPAYKGVIPTTQPLARFAVCADRLRRCAKFLATVLASPLADSGSAVIIVEVRGLYEPLVLRTASENPEQEGQAILMPFKDWPGSGEEQTHREEIVHAMVKAFPPPEEGKPGEKT